jgi:hypothetical protein
MIRKKQSNKSLFVNKTLHNVNIDLFSVPTFAVIL